jgi:hypothetical protein
MLFLVIPLYFTLPFGKPIHVVFDRIYSVIDPIYLVVDPIFYGAFSNVNRINLVSEPNIFGQRPNIFGLRPNIFGQKPNILGLRLGQRPNIFGR